MAKILVIDDEELNRFSIRKVLEGAGHEVAEAVDGVVGLEMQKKQNFNLIITDILMPKKEGLETLQEIKEGYPGISVIAISGGGRLGNMDFLSAAELLGADAILAKPFTDEQIVTCVSECLA
jgi:CheY-like chemotaxis protein